MGKPNNFWVRSLSALVFVAVVLGCTFFSPYTLLVLLVVICIGCMLEFFKLAASGGAQPLESYPTLVGALLVITAFFVKLGKVSPWLLAALLPLLFGLFVAELFRKKETPFANIAWSLLGIFYIALPLALLAYMPVQPATGGYIVYRPFVVLNILLIVWANDVGAYLTGITLGRHRLLERISPKKSWEGFFGGILCAVGVGLLLSHLQHLSLGLWGGAAAVIALAAVAGDLVESMLKRSVDVKDSGAIMPGHGGFLDRFDALLLAVPFVFTYLIIFS